MKHLLLALSLIILMIAPASGTEYRHGVSFTRCLIVHWAGVPNKPDLEMAVWKGWVDCKDLIPIAANAASKSIPMRFIGSWCTSDQKTYHRCQKDEGADLTIVESGYAVIDEVSCKALSVEVVGGKTLIKAECINLISSEEGKSEGVLTLRIIGRKLHVY